MIGIDSLDCLFDGDLFFSPVLRIDLAVFVLAEVGLVSVQKVDDGGAISLS